MTTDKRRIVYPARNRYRVFCGCLASFFSFMIRAVVVFQNNAVTDLQTEGCPSLVEIFGFAFFYPGCIVGPQVSVGIIRRIC